MRIACDHCGAEVEKDDAVAFEDEEGEVLWFCSEACRETAVLLDDEEEDRTAARGPAV